MNFQNIGNYNAGVVGGKAPGAMGGVPVMDADGVASGGAFLVSELEKRDPLIRKPLTSFTYPRDIVVETGGGWADYVSAMSVAYGLTGGAGGSPVAAGGVNGIPTVQASVDKGVYKAHTFAVAMRVMFQDMQRSDTIGRSLDSLLQNGVRLAYDKHNDENVYVGLAPYGTTGLLNNPDATETTAAKGSAGDSAWAKRHSQPHSAALRAVSVHHDRQGHRPGRGDHLRFPDEKQRGCKGRRRPVYRAYQVVQGRGNRRQGPDGCLQQ